MRYSLTFTTDPNAYDWGETDTIIFEYPTTLPDYPQLNKLVKQVLKQYGLNEEMCEHVAGEKGWWFIRNVSDVDVVIEKETK